MIHIIHKIAKSPFCENPDFRSYLTPLISRFPLFITRYRDLGQNCPKADATTSQIKDDATVKLESEF